MFRTVPLSTIRSFSLYTQQWYMPYRSAGSLRAGSGLCFLILLASCMTYSIAMCTVKISWWWTEELSETCRVLFQKWIWEISASSWFCYKNISRCTVTWTSKAIFVRVENLHIWRVRSESNVIANRIKQSNAIKSCAPFRFTAPVFVTWKASNLLQSLF
jgi:hypothetical protein